MSRARRIAARPDRCPGLHLLHGPGGAGKTHLLQGIAAHLGPAWSARPLSRAVMINLAPDRLGDLRDRLHGAGALLIDGLEDVPCREITQLEILAAAEAVAKRGRPVVFTSRKPLVEPDGWLPSLRERILEGAHLPLHPPSPASRVRIARGVLGSWGLKRREDLSVRLIDGLGGGLGGLDTRITGMLARCRSISELPRVEMPGGPQQRGPRAAPRAVVALVSRHFRLRPAELRGTSRSPRVTLPRQIAMYLLRRQCELSYPEIAQRFHRHHTTAMHACRRISAQRQASSDLESTLRLLENALGAIGKTGG